MDRVFRGQQVGEVLAPLGCYDGPLIQIIVEPRRAQIVLGGDAVEVEVGQRAGAAVIVHDGEGGAADRVGAAKPFGKALTECGFARAEAAGKRDERPVRQGGGHPPAQRDSLLPRSRNKLSHKMHSYLETRSALFAKGSPTRGAGERSETERLKKEDDRSLPSSSII